MFNLYIDIGIFADGSQLAYVYGLISRCALAKYGLTASYTLAKLSATYKFVHFIKIYHYIFFTMI